MATSEMDARQFCETLRERLTTTLVDVVAVRNQVEAMRSQNSFRESCFCKGLVLPVVDALATQFLAERFGATRDAVRHSLRCEGFDSPMYTCDRTQVGFSSHSRSNSYHAGDKSRRRAKSRRSPDFCVRHEQSFRMVGELKYVERSARAQMSRLVEEIQNYLSIKNEPTSDWGHDFAFGLLYEYGGAEARRVEISTAHWDTDRIYILKLGGV
jgi:hypothetical protein